MLVTGRVTILIFLPSTVIVVCLRLMLVSPKSVFSLTTGLIYQASLVMSTKSRQIIHKIDKYLAESPSRHHIPPR